MAVFATANALIVSKRYVCTHGTCMLLSVLAHQSQVACGRFIVQSRCLMRTSGNSEVGSADRLLLYITIRPCSYTYATHCAGRVRSANRLLLCITIKLPSSMPVYGYTDITPHRILHAAGSACCAGCCCCLLCSLLAGCLVLCAAAYWLLAAALWLL